MAENNIVRTTFQNLSRVFNGSWGVSNGIADTSPSPTVPHASYSSISGSDVLYTAKNLEDYNTKKLELQQEKYLQNRWIRVNRDLSMSVFAGLPNVKLMYRDADLMDSYPEIGAALDLISEESVCTSGSKSGMVVNVSSSSDRIRYILEDLFVNRLNLQVTAQMVIRAMCKYGNQFMLLDIDKKLGVKGWRQLPVGEVERIENGIINPYSYNPEDNGRDPEEKDMSTKFVWTAESGGSVTPFKNWQIAHFRLLHNSMFLPYGVSALMAARRHFRMLALMEDMMLIYRLERSMERRVYKIYVGSLDDEDIPGFVEQIANQFKRTPIVDPLTGQLDLRKNILCAADDIFIPVRDQNAQNPIDTLAGAKNLDAIDDIKYIQKKVCAALRIPQSFLNFEEATGDGKNLALMDVRFARTINRYQQAFLMELTKIATIHLFLLGFEDDLTNFNLTMNNPSTQSEQLELENLQKKVSIIRDMVSDPGQGIPVSSLQRALKMVMKMSDKEILDNFGEIRLEAALANELEKTGEIIKRTGIFDSVDRIYGEPGAEYSEDTGSPDGEGGFGEGGGGGFGGGLDDFGSPGSDEGMEETGEEGEEPVEDMEGEESGGAEEVPMESALRKKRKPLITEGKGKQALATMMFNKILDEEEKKNKRVNIFDKNLMINEEIDGIVKGLNEIKED